MDGKVYNVTSFLDSHPGGRKILLRVAGTDASKQFHTYHSPQVMMRFGPKLEVGEVGSALAAVQKEEKAAVKPGLLLSGDNEVFGDLAPFCEPGGLLS